MDYHNKYVIVFDDAFSEDNDNLCFVESADSLEMLVNINIEPSEICVLKTDYNFRKEQEGSWQIGDGGRKKGAIYFIWRKST